ncbi:MAG: hypothetical protein Q8M19_05435 [Reyranella sp.]|nr:hypothetical protein [Reyranella sp.]MDP2330125.1 hypothetical protein [Reyranella sp.]
MRYLALSLLLLAVRPAWADGAFDALKRVGLAGTWAPNCALPPADGNRRHTYFADEAGKARLRFDPGDPQAVRTVAIMDVSTPLHPGTVQLMIVYDDERWAAARGATWTHVIEIVPDSRHRLMQAVRQDGRAMVKDGVIVASGKPAPTLERCDGPAS